MQGTILPPEEVEEVTLQVALSLFLKPVFFSPISISQLSPGSRGGKLGPLVTPSSDVWNGNSSHSSLPLLLAPPQCPYGVSGLRLCTDHPILVPVQLRMAAAVLLALDALNFGTPLHVAIMAPASPTGCKKQGRAGQGHHVHCPLQWECPQLFSWEPDVLRTRQPS